MSPSFLAFGEALVQAARLGPVITPNERLARELAAALATANLLEGRPVTCTSWQGWMRRLYERSNRRRDQRRLLPAAGFSLLVNQLEGVDTDGQRALIEEAWTLCHHFRLQPDTHSGAAQQYLAWHDAIRQRLERTHSVTAAELGSVLLEQPAPSTHLALIGFDDLNPAQQLLLGHWESTGMQIRRLEAEATSPVSAHRIELPQGGDELRAAAWWAKGVLAGDPEARIAVLVPGLESTRDIVLRQFGAIIDPSRGSRSFAFDVGGGSALNTTLLWRDCETLLQSLDNPVPTESLLRVLRSPHFTLDCTVAATRLPALVTLRLVAEVSGHAQLKQLCDIRDRAAALAPLRDQLEVVERLLGSAGWSNSGAGSQRFQIQQATAQALRALTAEAGWQPEQCGFSTALQRLGRHLGTQVHAPQRPASRLRIMGYLETAGLHFTHLWICGASETTLPGPAHPNPFLAADRMRRAGVKRMDAASELAFSRQLVARWRSQTTHLVVSHAALETGEHLSGTALFADLPLLQAEACAFAGGPAHAWLEGLTDHSIAWEDQAVSTLPRGRLRGGTSLLANQAACSFRAFGCHRLNLAEPVTAHALLDPLERGSLLHAVLETVMRVYPSSVALGDATGDQFATIIRRQLAVIDRPLPARFIEAEIQRLTILLLAWQSLELRRPGFRVRDVEHNLELDLDGWRLNLKLDRIDEYAGQAVVIDYKSGAPQSLKPLLENGAPRAPQLPAYAVALPEAAGVFYLNVREKPVARGVGNTRIDGIGLGSPHVIEDWDGQRERWRAELQDLVNAFVAGPVRALPADRKRCLDCHIRPICRIDADDEASEGDESAGETQAESE